jgi:branched-chain amino acid transport system permease protein
LTVCWKSFLLHALVGGALFAFPWFGSDFYVDLIVRLMIFAIFAMSLDLLVGFTGLVSFGHAAFFGLAGYILASITPDSAPVSLWLAAFATLAGVAAAAAVVGYFAVRTTGVYFIMITLAFAQMLHYYFNESVAFGGSDGMFIMFRPAVEVGGVSVLDLHDPLTFYYAVAGTLITVYVLLAAILLAPFGHVIRAVRTNESRTMALGYPTFWYKLASFVIAGTLAGLAGMLEAIHTGYVSPGHLSWHQSGLVMMMVILGGVGTLYGAVIGVFAFGLMRDKLQDVTEYNTLVIGIFIIAVVAFFPRGIGGAFFGNAAASKHERKRPNCR